MILAKEIKELEEMLPHAEKQNATVSQRGVDWHVDHSLKVINSICKALKTSNPDEYQKKFSFLRSFFFAKGSFPRGRVKAPKIVNNENPILPEELKSQLDLARENAKMLETLPENSFFKHPIFGNLNKKQTIKFFRLHTRHHYKIMKDIVG